MKADTFLYMLESSINDVKDLYAKAHLTSCIYIEDENAYAILEEMERKRDMLRDIVLKLGEGKE